MSNLLRLAGLRGAELAGEIAFRPAQAHEIDAGLRLIVSNPGGRSNVAQLAEFAHLAAQPGDMGGLWVAATADGVIQSAALPIVSPGRTMLLVPPADNNTPARLAVGRQLIDRICQVAAAQGVHLAQALLDPIHANALGFLAACGFSPLAELLYLQADLRRAVAPAALPLGYELLVYADDARAEFAHAVLASYQQSLDCPALNGMRHSDDIIEGHRAAGEFDPRTWFLLRVHGQASAVLLLSRVPRTDAMELVYLGLTPEARGKGIGDLLMRQALASACERECAYLSLAVDAANLPALRLYWRHGMRTIGRKVAMFKDLRATGRD